MNLSSGLIRLVIVGLVLLIGSAYWRGWQRLRRSGTPLATPARLSLLINSLLLILLATLPPLYTLSHSLLYVRALQKIMVAMVAAPMFWLACPLHVILRGLAFERRQHFMRWLAPTSWGGRLTHVLGQPALAWLFYVCAIVIWHDSAVVDWSMRAPLRHYLTLMVLFVAALLYWVQITGTGLYTKAKLPGWMLFVYAVGVEIPNMTAGVTIAYSSAPLYNHYAALHTARGTSVIDDQMISGGLVWFMGSVVFFSSAVMIVNRLFKANKGDGADHHPDWDSEERMIAPGLEHRLDEKR